MATIKISGLPLQINHQVGDSVFVRSRGRVATIADIQVSAGHVLYRWKADGVSGLAGESDIGAVKEAEELKEFEILNINKANQTQIKNLIKEIAPSLPKGSETLTKAPALARLVLSDREALGEFKDMENFIGRMDFKEPDSIWKAISQRLEFSTPDSLEKVN